MAEAQRLSVEWGASKNVAAGQRDDASVAAMVAEQRQQTGWRDNGVGGLRWHWEQLPLKSWRWRWRV